jgi:hypothetical protein
MRLRRLQVRGLFGLFDHEVPFDLDRRITLIHAPNGYGKTVILKIIAAFFGGSLKTFRDYEYSEIIFEFDNGTTAVVAQSSGQPELDLGERQTASKSYKIRYYDGESAQEYDPQETRPESDRWVATSSALERYVPQLKRIATNRWVDVRLNRYFTTPEVYRFYSDLLPARLRRRVPLPEWLSKVRSSIDCRLIDTQRLLTSQRTDNSSQGDESNIPTAKIYSSELATELSGLLANSAIEAQSLDQTFPSRILRRLASAEPVPNEAELREKLAGLIEKRSRLASAGLLDASETDDVLSHDQFDDSTRRVFDVYVADTSRKLSVYDSMLARLELLKSLLNSRLQFKKVSFNKDRGFEFVDVQGRHIAPESLSSGEQHELVLNFDLLFHAKKDNLILIDEPEISLHIAWQKRFIHDLRRIIELTGIDTVLCTHSPQLIGDFLDRAVQLRGPVDDKFLDRRN